MQIVQRISYLIRCRKFKNFEIAGKEYRIVKYADHFVLLLKEESVLQGIVNTITGIGRYYGIKMNMEITKVK